MQEVKRDVVRSTGQEDSWGGHVALSVAASPMDRGRVQSMGCKLDMTEVALAFMQEICILLKVGSLEGIRKIETHNRCF